MATTALMPGLVVSLLDNVAADPVEGNAFAMPARACVLSVQSIPVANGVVSELGLNGDGTSQFPGSGDRAIVCKFTSVGGGTITGGGARFSADSVVGSSVKLVIVSDLAGEPDETLYVSDAVAVPAGGGLVEFTLTGTIEAATDYWVGVVWSDFQSNIQNVLDASVTRYSNSFTYASPPASWPGTDGSGASELSVYVTYESSDGPTAIDISINGSTDGSSWNELANLNDPLGEIATISTAVPLIQAVINSITGGTFVTVNAVARDYAVAPSS